MGMGFSLMQIPEMKQTVSLSQTQKQTLKYILSLRLELVHPEFPNMSKGLEGMIKAHEILQDRDSVGVLIGGLSEEVWNQRRTPEDLYKHKDVDVLVLTDHFNLSKQFEGGIDWWLPREEKLSIKSPYTIMENVPVRWYTNGFDVPLSFGSTQRIGLEPGLYIPGPEWVFNMREAEVKAHIDYKITELEVDDNVLERFKSSMKMGTKLPKFLREKFKGYILEDHYEPDYQRAGAIEIEKFDFDTYGAVYRRT